MSNLLQEAKAMAETIRADRHYLHEHAETEFDLTETRRYVFDALTKMGYTPEPCGKAARRRFVKRNVTAPQRDLRHGLHSSSFSLRRFFSADFSSSAAQFRSYSVSSIDRHSSRSSAT